MTISQAARAAGMERQALGDAKHALLVLDQAGWHEAKTLRIPPNMTLEPLPPRSPELNPMERVWLFLKEKFLSHRLLDDDDAILDAAAAAWNRMPRRKDALLLFAPSLGLSTASVHKRDGITPA